MKSRAATRCVPWRLPAILPRLPSGGGLGGAARVKTRLTLVDCLGIGVNGIIGSGIFLLPARVFAAAGGLAWASWFAVGGVCLLVGLCFGEVASGTERSGGPYAYARAAQLARRETRRGGERPLQRRETLALARVRRGGPVLRRAASACHSRSVR